jgi:hypothetical protein
VFYACRDDVHGVLVHLYTRVRLSVKMNIFGYDDQLNKILLHLAQDPTVKVQVTPDKSQASGVDEKAISSSDAGHDAAAFAADFAVGQSDTGQISHTKGGARRHRRLRRLHQLVQFRGPTADVMSQSQGLLVFKSLRTGVIVGVVLLCLSVRVAVAVADPPGLGEPRIDPQKSARQISAFWRSLWHATGRIRTSLSIFSLRDCSTLFSASPRVAAFDQDRGQPLRLGRVRTGCLVDSEGDHTAALVSPAVPLRVLRGGAAIHTDRNQPKPAKSGPSQEITGE